MPKRLRPQSEVATAAATEVGMRPVIGAVAQLARHDASVPGAANNGPTTNSFH